MSDRFLLASVAASGAFALQTFAFFASIGLIFACPPATPAAFLLVGFAASQRLEFCVALIPAFVRAACAHRWLSLIGLSVAVAAVVVADRTVGLPSLCLNMGVRLRVRALLRTDGNGLLWSAGVASVLAVFGEGQMAFGAAVGVAALAALALPFGSGADRELSGVMVVRLLAYAWVAIVASRQRGPRAWVAIAAMAGGVAAAAVRSFRSSGIEPVQ